MTPQVEGGLELAQAIDSLARVLSRASLQVQQGESVFRVEPVELALQVTAARIGPGLDGIEWRVLGLGDQAVSEAGTLHRLTMRFAPRSPRRVSGQDTKEQGSDLQTIAQKILGYDYQQGVGGLPEPLILASLRRSRETERPESAALAGASEVIAVRVRYLDVGQPGRLVIEQKFMRRPGSPESDRKLVEIRRILDETHRGHAERKRLVEATADYVASLVDNAIVRPETYQWEIQGVPDPAAVSAMLDRSQQWLQGLVKRPFESAATQMGVPSLVAGPIGAIGANVVIAPVARDVQDATQIIDVVGIIIGATTGVHPLVIACIKHLADTEFHKAVANGVTKVFNGLLAGSIDEPLSARATRPAAPGRDAWGRAWYLSLPAAPAEQPEPQPSASSPPEPAAAPPRPPIPPTPGISGPGGLG